MSKEETEKWDWGWILNSKPSFSDCFNSKMVMESSEWPSGDILSGAVDYMGNYDECLTISSYGIKGQYCLTEVIYDYPDTLMKNTVEEIPNETISVWEALDLYKENPVMMDRKKLRFAMCIPSSCKPVDLKISLSSTLNPIFKAQELDISVNVNPIFCKINEEFTYALGFYIVGWSFVVLFLFVICCTFFDNENGTPNNCLLSDVRKSFSLTRNFQRLTKFNPKDQAGLHLFKFINMLAMIYCHHFYYIAGFPTSNAIAIERLYLHWPILFVHVNSVADPFFMISGFLKFHLDLSAMSERGKFFLFSSILFRWIRMVPVFGVLMLFIANVLPYIGDGPIWDDAISKEVNNCKESWWTILLVINNMVKANKMCLIAAWYIAVDVQLSIIGGILLYIFSKNRKIGIFATILTFVAFSFLTFIICYVNDYNAIMLYLINAIKKDIRNDEEFSNFYVAMYPRCGPYLVGFLSAYAVKILKEKNFKFTKIQIYSVFLISLMVTEMGQFYGLRFHNFNKQYDRFENALYAAVNRSLFVIVMAVTVILYSSSGLGIFQRFFDAKIWIPLGRLTYSVFLINTLLQLYHAASQKKPIALPNMMNIDWDLFGDILLNYTIAVILHLFVEAPILGLKTIIQKQLMKKYKPNKNIEDKKHEKEITNESCV